MVSWLLFPPQRTYGVTDTAVRRSLPDQLLIKQQTKSHRFHPIFILASLTTHVVFVNSEWLSETIPPKYPISTFNNQLIFQHGSGLAYQLGASQIPERTTNPKPVAFKASRRAVFTNTDRAAQPQGYNIQQA